MLVRFVEHGSRVTVASHVGEREGEVRLAARDTLSQRRPGAEE